jgi:gluconolactonase
MQRLEVAAFVAFTEGPAAAPDGSVYFADIVNDRILRLAPGGDVELFRSPSGRTNGQVFDAAGRLWHCEGAEFGPNGGRRVSRTDLESGRYEVVTDRYEGRRYNAPNDICVDGLGRLFFTDPCYTEPADLELDVKAVYRIDPDGGVERIVSQPEIQSPNGIAVTQDGATLYVVDSNHAAGGNRKIWGFDVDTSGRTSNQRLVFDFGTARGGDGMELDLDGNLYVAAGANVARDARETTAYPAGVYVITPAGELFGSIPVPEDRVTNVAFGGPDGRTLYVTAGKTLFRTVVDVPGQVAFRWW